MNAVVGRESRIAQKFQDEEWNGFPRNFSFSKVSVETCEGELLLRTEKRDKLEIRKSFATGSSYGSLHSDTSSTESDILF